MSEHMTEQEWAVGQKALVSNVNDRGRGPFEVTVLKVGRKYVTVGERGWSKEFHLASGDANDNYGHHHLWTLDEWASRERRVDAISRLKRLGLQAVGYGDPRLDTDTIEAICDLIEPLSRTVAASEGTSND